MTDKNITVVYFSVEHLIPYARNSRVHSDAQVAQIAASIREFGFTNPVLIDGDDGIIAGHGRVLAARKLGMGQVPCIRLAHLSEAQKRAYVIADNKLALNAGWDEEMLSLECVELENTGFDLALTGFTELELGILHADEIDMPSLPTGEKAEFQQITFTLHDSQAEQVQQALVAAKALGNFIDSPNENSNGNAIARICETFLTNHGDR
jgi:ParB family chromosome partitioning protein